MELKFVVPKAEGTFGELEFGAKCKEETRRVNGQNKILSRSYHLFSPVQKAEDVIVILPGSVGEKTFKYEDKVKLVNPSITVDGRNANGVAYADYTLYADDLVKA